MYMSHKTFIILLLALSGVWANKYYGDPHWRRNTAQTTVDKPTTLNPLLLLDPFDPELELGSPLLETASMLPVG